MKTIHLLHDSEKNYIGMIDSSDLSAVRLLVGDVHGHDRPQATFDNLQSAMNAALAIGAKIVRVCTSA